MILDFSFPKEYSVENAELPSGGEGGLPVYYFAAPHSGRGESWSFAIEITPQESSPWIGVFGRNPDVRSKCSVVMSTPDPSTLLVVAEGQAFLVKVNTPQEIDHPKCLPVMQAMPLIAQNLVLLGNRTDLLAIGAHGTAWKSGRLVTDDLHVFGVLDGVIEASGWVGSEGGDVEFQVDPTNGQRLGRQFLV